MTDNAQNMNGARKAVMDSQMKEIQTLESAEKTKDNVDKLSFLRDHLLVDVFGCSAHLLNLWYPCKMVFSPNFLFVQWPGYCGHDNYCKCHNHMQVLEKQRGPKVMVNEGKCATPSHAFRN